MVGSDDRPEHLFAAKGTVVTAAGTQPPDGRYALCFAERQRGRMFVKPNKHHGGGAENRPYMKAETCAILSLMQFIINNLTYLLMQKRADSMGPGHHLHVWAIQANR